jgi:hypothetical protein
MNRKLKNLISLNQNIRIYVPLTTNVNESFDNSEKVNETLTLLAGYFGGATTYEAFGAWLSVSGQIVKERVTICEAFCKESQVQEHIEGVYDFCLKLKTELAQEVIAFELNGVMHFV